jgi:hypothetical protein
MMAEGSGMTEQRPTVADEIERYLLTGETDLLHAAWSGDFMQRAERAHEDLRGALVSAVRQRVEGLKPPPDPDADTVNLTRAKVAPMVRGLFSRAERDTVLAALEQSVIFVTSANIEQLLFGRGFDSTTWTMANLYLAGFGAKLLGDDPPDIVGFSVDATCFVSPQYFAEEGPFADFVVHEVAHIFHNCKRPAIGLRQTRRKEWLLDIEYLKRETFAYACEAYARVLERSNKSRAGRQALAEEYGRESRISDERIDAEEIADIVRAAAAARNGWKVILARCSPTTKHGRI